MKGGIPISGLFDLSPFPASFLQPHLRLSADEIARVSPQANIRATLVPLVVAWGAAESKAFARQSVDFLTAWRAAGNIGEALPIKDANHFMVLDGFMTPDGLMTTVLDEMRKKVETGSCSPTLPEH